MAISNIVPGGDGRRAGFSQPLKAGGTLYAYLATVWGEIESNRMAMRAAQKVVEGEFTRFDIGQTSNEELLRAQDLLAVTSRSFARAITDYNTTIRELDRVQGDLPEGITMEDPIR